MRDVLRVREFQAMCAAEFLSYAGDQIARVGLAVLVFNRTDSAALTGLTYMMTFLPSVVGALVLSGLADRKPRRELIIVLDLAQAALVVAMLTPGMPLAGLCVLVGLVSLLTGPYKAAHLALLRDVLDADLYPLGMAVRQSQNNAAQLMGFAGGGVLAASVSPRLCMSINALSFLASAAIVAVGVVRRPAARTTSGGGGLRSGLVVVWGDPKRRAIFLATFLSACYVAPEALAAPVAATLNQDPIMVGLLLASCCAGAVVGVPLLSRLLPALRRSAAFPVLLVLTGLPLALLPLHGDIYLAMVVFAVGGALWAIQVVMLSANLVELLPDSHRAQGMGVAASMNRTAMGVGAGLAGLLAEAVGPVPAIGVAGVAATLLAVVPGALWIRSSRSATGLHEPAVHLATEPGA
ncbi:MFS transporter [Phytohabitans flavus]|uniref:MFS transporter n=1 Tax=Phytohabitans flavus TaxID=1076124 RepID=UPI001565D9CD|nr:MFS transporter [Phytohabitans flavus]